MLGVGVVSLADVEVPPLVDVEVFPPVDVEVLDPAEGLFVPEVVLVEVTGSDAPSGGFDSLEHDTTSGGITMHQAAERKADKWVFLMAKPPTDLELCAGHSSAENIFEYDTGNEHALPRAAPFRQKKFSEFCRTPVQPAAIARCWLSGWATR